MDPRALQVFQPLVRGVAWAGMTGLRTGLSQGALVFGGLRATGGGLILFHLLFGGKSGSRPATGPPAPVAGDQLRTAMAG